MDKSRKLTIDKPESKSRKPYGDDDALMNMASIPRRVIIPNDDCFKNSCNNNNVNKRSSSNKHRCNSHRF